MKEKQGKKDGGEEENKASPPTASLLSLRVSFI
jgi:hypothetical protein